MTDGTKDTLLRAFQSAYAELKSRLSVRLGSADLAGDALHEMYLRLERTSAFEPVRNPKAYLYKAAINTAANIRKTERRYITNLEREMLLEVRDDTPGPDRVLEARRDMERVEHAMSRLTPRQKRIFFGFYFEGLDTHALAKEHGLSVRTIQAELKAATRRIREPGAQKKLFALRPPKLSSD